MSDSIPITTDWASPSLLVRRVGRVPGDVLTDGSAATPSHEVTTC
jgi:hypothetical protein